jgi:hypothetical protein
MFWGCVAALLVEWYCDTPSGREPVPFVTWTVCFGTGGRLHGDLELKLESRSLAKSDETQTRRRLKKKNISVEKCPNEASIKVQMDSDPYKVRQLGRGLQRVQGEQSALAHRR